MPLSSSDSVSAGGVEGPNAPVVTIAIITRDRKDELRRAVQSACEQTGCPKEVLVIDDGSQDGTAAMLGREFPSVRVVRYDDDADVAVRRNDAAELARGQVIVSIDDDAVFSSPHVVADTLKDFDHPRIAAVAMPYIDVGIEPQVQQRAPDDDDRWITTIFRATAYAVRRESFDEIGGYTPRFQQFGEEWDLSLKLLEAGYVIRLGRSDPIYHYTSTKRDYRRMDVYQRRNELLISWLYFPPPWNLAYMVGYAFKGIRAGIRLGRTVNMIIGVAAGLRACARARGHRHPISRRAFQFDQRSRSRARAGTAFRLDEAEAALGPLGPRAKSMGSGWPGPSRWLYTRLRRARTTVVRTLGRPVRCEVCGREVFRGLPVMWGGRLKLLGAETTLVRADWDKMNRMTFRHVELDKCERK